MRSYGGVKSISAGRVNVLKHASLILPLPSHEQSDGLLSAHFLQIAHIIAASHGCLRLIHNHFYLRLLVSYSLLI